MQMLLEVILLKKKNVEGTKHRLVSNIHNVKKYMNL